jgi:outer membrane protein assembly factor BamB
MVADGKIYLGDEDGDVVILQPGKTLKVLAEMNMGSSVYGTTIAANGTLFISNRNQLYAITANKGSSASAAR